MAKLEFPPLQLRHCEFSNWCHWSYAALYATWRGLHPINSWSTRSFLKEGLPENEEVHPMLFFSSDENHNPSRAGEYSIFVYFQTNLICFLIQRISRQRCRKEKTTWPFELLGRLGLGIVKTCKSQASSILRYLVLDCTQADCEWLGRPSKCLGGVGLMLHPIVAMKTG